VDAVNQSSVPIERSQAFADALGALISLLTLFALKRERKIEFLGATLRPCPGGARRGWR